MDFNPQKGFGQVTVTGDSKVAKVFVDTLKLNSYNLTARGSVVPAQHYKLSYSTPQELKAGYDALAAFRFNHPEYTQVEIKQDTSRKTVYLWHNKDRVRKQRANPNPPFAGGYEEKS